jgi:AcrR family transcriptional regulator
VLGTDRASLYYYVGSKEELLQEIVHLALDRDIKAAKAIKRSRATTPEKIQALIESMVMSYAENYPHIHVYIEDLGRIARQDDEWSKGVLKQTREYEALVLSILNKGREEGTVRRDLSVNISAMALFGMINWMHRWFRPGAGASPTEIAETLKEIFLHGYTAKV